MHAALSGDGTFGIVRWDERFTADEEDEAGQATCEGGEHWPLIGLLTATLARTLQAHLAAGERNDFIVSLSGVRSTSA